MTNNSEKSLPDAFLRRCIYYNIAFPTGERLKEIVLARLPEFVRADGGMALSSDAIVFMLFIRQESIGLEKRPGTAELLNWLSAIVKLGGKPESPLTEQIDVARRALPAFAKISGDQMRARELLASWGHGRSLT
jgi:MoxR-like ATPase